jgi:serine/threonine-protein phosphatase 2A regulatory subunit B
MTADWQLVQVLGDKPVSELVDGDVVSAVEFDQSGDYLATGDRGGRVRIYEKGQASGAAASSNAAAGAKKGEEASEYRLWHEFQSHDAEFDYLKSLEIEEKINCLRWCKPLTSAFLLLTTNDKTIKLWRVNDKSKSSSSIISSFVDKKAGASTGAAPARRLFPAPSPKAGVCASPRRVFANGHAYHINSISLNSDCETFIRYAR